MKVLSLFDGISTGQYCLNDLGYDIEEYYASEIDKSAIAISKYNFPDIVQIGDVSRIDFNEYANKGIDLISSGSPCQNLSIANKNRQGIFGKESNLFFYFLRALEIVKPKYFIQENVASMKNEDKEIITKALTALYPDTQCYCINSSLVSAQKRNRYYWTNIPNVTQPEDKGIMLKDIAQPVEEITENMYLSEKMLANFARPSGKNGSFHFKPMDVNVVEKCPTLTARYFKMGRTDPYIIVSDGSVKQDGDTLRALNNKKIELKDSEEPYALKEVRTEEGKALRRQARLDGKGDTTPRTADCKMFVPKDDDKANCLTTSSNIESVIVQPMENKNKLIRKLTPLECERLQTMGDEYTKYGINEQGNTYELSNTARYKALGNGWTCDVIAHIFSGLK